MAGLSDASGMNGPPEASAPNWVQKINPQALIKLITDHTKLLEAQGGGGQPQGGLPPEQGDAMAQMNPQGQAPQPGGAPMGPPMPPGTGQQGLMARGSPAIQPNSGAMPFMGGGGAQGANPMAAMASAQQQPQYATTTRATVPDLGQPPTVDDAISMASSIAPAGGLKTDLIMKSFDFLNNQYKSQTADKLKVYEGNIQQAGGLNDQQTALANMQNRGGNQQFDRAMQLAQFANDTRKTDADIGFKQALTGTGGGQVDMSSVPQTVMNQAKALVEGRAPYPTSLNRNPGMRQALQVAQQLDPNYDANTSKARLKMQSELSSTRPNTIGGSIVSYNTVQQHLANAAQAVEKLDNSEFGRLPNKAANALPNVVNPTRQKALSSFNIAKQNVATEIEKMIKSGVPDVEGLKSRMEQINPDDPPSVQMNALRELQNTVSARQQNLEEAFRQTMGEQGVSAWEAKNKRPFSFTSPESKKAQDYTSSINDWVSGGKQGPAPSLAGGGSSPPPEAIKLLKSGKGTPAQFDAIFGKGAAAHVMGQ